ncbi:hypothetical protein [Oribacterium sp. NK2B42]|uniref:hypothetical protein n=1 Tax=Oribacterium sp. NK2B42 TaxID=689781 RepID=UPI0004924649|nr:hypothetical protein [Oribacterium sp. NK2B42]
MRQRILQSVNSMAVGAVFSIVRPLYPEDDAVACAEVYTEGIDIGEILFALAVSVRPVHAVLK